MFIPAIFKQKWTTKRLLSAMVVIFVLFGLIYLIFQRLNPATPPDLGPTSVEVTIVSYQNIPMTINAIGSLVAPEATMLKAQVAGVVSQVAFKNGQNVAQNQLLLQLDNVATQAAYAKAQAVLTEAKSTYERYQSLEQQDPDVLSKLQIDQVLSQYQQAQADVTSAAKALQNMQIRAPFAGTTGSTTLAVGSYVNQGDNIVAIVNRSTLEISYNLPESYYGEVKVGQTVNFTSDAYPGKTFKATVDYVAPLINQTNRAFSVRALVENNQQELSPGMLVNLTQVLKTENKVLAVPSISLVSNMSGYAVYTIEGGKVLAVPVQVGARFGDQVEIISGLSAGTQVISAGQEKVQPGSQVTVMNQGS